MRLAPPWSIVAATLFGILTLSLAVQIAAMFGTASRFVLTAIWVFFAELGLVNLLRRARGAK
nr:MAG: hypothetical protein E4H34_05425 [Hyphomicrobiales bacterium]